jgi:hypothetical protein
MDMSNSADGRPYFVVRPVVQTCHTRVVRAIADLGATLGWRAGACIDQHAPRAMYLRLLFQGCLWLIQDNVSSDPRRPKCPSLLSNAEAAAPRHFLSSISVTMGVARSHRRIASPGGIVPYLLRIVRVSRMRTVSWKLWRMLQPSLRRLPFPLLNSWPVSLHT